MANSAIKVDRNVVNKLVAGIVKAGTEAQKLEQERIALAEKLRPAMEPAPYDPNWILQKIGSGNANTSV
jgi:hypothetical protein